MKKILFLIGLLVVNFSYAKDVDFAQIDVKLNIDATVAADPYDNTNEYQVAFCLRDKNTNERLAYLKGSTSRLDKIIGGWKRVKVGDSAEFNTSVKLPVSLLEEVELRVTVVEHDPVVPLPGPCCINISDDDSLLKENFDLTGFLYREKRLFFERDGGTASIEFIKADWGTTDIASIVDFQYENVLRDGKRNQKSFLNLVKLILEQ